jgi:hypothetical protein
MREAYRVLEAALKVGLLVHYAHQLPVVNPSNSVPSDFIAGSNVPNMS